MPSQILGSWVVRVLVCPKKLDRMALKTSGTDAAHCYADSPCERMLVSGWTVGAFPTPLLALPVHNGQRAGIVSAIVL